MAQLNGNSHPDRLFNMILTESEVAALHCILTNLHCYQDSQDPRVQYLSQILQHVWSGYPRVVSPTYDEVCSNVLKSWEFDPDELEDEADRTLQEV